MIWLIGGPGSGKGTQSHNIAQKYRFAHIDPCALVKHEMESKGPISKTFASFLARGKEVPLDDILPLIRREQKEHSHAKGFVIDGYPGSLHEAEILEHGLGPPDIVIAMEVAEEQSTARTSSLHYSTNRPSLSEYVAASKAVIEKYEDIALKIDSNQDPSHIFEVIQFNIETLNTFQKRQSEQRNSSYKAKPE